MDRIINVKVGGNYLSKDNKNAGVRGEANVTQLRITFDEGWRYYAKTVTFWDAQGSNPVKRVETTDLIEDITTDTLTYLTPIPKEALAIAGELTFVIDGYLDGKRQRSIADKLVVKNSPYTDNATEPTDPTPTQAELLQKQIDGIIDTINDAVIAGEEAKDARDEAAMKAQDSLVAMGEAKRYAEEAESYSEKAQNAAGKTSYIGDNGNWFAWDIVKDGFYDTGVKAQAGSTVYCGETPPEDADVWIDPNGESITITVDDALSFTSTNPVQNQVVAEAVEKLEPFVVEATLTKGTDTLGAVYYSVSSSVTAEEVQTARIKGQSLILKLTDDKGYSTYSPVYYWIESYGLVRWYVHYEDGLLEVAFADIIDPQGYPFWYVTYCEYASTEYTDKAVEKLEPFIINATLNEDNTITSEVTFAEIKEAYEQGKEIILRCAVIDDSDNMVIYSSLFTMNDNSAMWQELLGNINIQVFCSELTGWSTSFYEMADRDYVDIAIGDIETSLENIITKYGLGGDNV